MDMTVKEAQAAVDSWIHQYGVRYFNELTNMAVLTEEVGELARLISRGYGEQSFKEGERGSGGAEDLRAALADEMADVMWVLMCLANQTGVDLDNALRRNMEKKTARDKGRHISNGKLNTGAL